MDRGPASPRFQLSDCSAVLTFIRHEASTLRSVALKIRFSTPTPYRVDGLSSGHLMAFFFFCSLCLVFQLGKKRGVLLGLGMIALSHNRWERRLLISSKHRICIGFGASWSVFDTSELFFAFTDPHSYFFMSLLCTGLRWMTLCFWKGFLLMPLFYSGLAWGLGTFLVRLQWKMGDIKGTRWNGNGNRWCGFGPIWSVMRLQRTFFLERK